MIEGQNPGTSGSLTVDAAATVFEGLLSAEETKPTVKTTKAPESEVDDTEPDDSEEEEPTESPDEDETSDDESEEAEESDEDAEAAEDDEEAPEATPKPRTHKVKVDGEDVEVEEDELLRGYSRTADYTRKTQQLAAERKTFESEAAAIRVERQKYATALTQLNDALSQMNPAEPDWNTLRQENPTEYAATWAAWQQHEKEVAAVESERQSIIATLTADQQREAYTVLEAEKAKLVEAIPSWKDESKAKAEKSAIAEYARNAGYTDEDLASVTDHRAMVMLRKAMLFDASQAKAKAVKPIVKQRIEAVKVSVPGSKVTKPKDSASAKARGRLAKTGRVSDAAATILTMLGDDD